MYFIKTPLLLKKLFSNYHWHVATKEKKIYLSFDDGPHPIATPFVLDQLAIANAKATFFCIGKNVWEHPNIYDNILSAGHAVGNHTHNHLNGWKTDTDAYIENIEKAATLIKSKLFRPPYGRITPKQGRRLLEKGFKLVMWDVLSADFDAKITSEKCYNHVVNKTNHGSIVVFHDSEKAYKNLSYALPKVLKYFSERSYAFEAIDDDTL